MRKQGVWNRLNTAMAVNTLLNWKILMVLLQSMIRKADGESTADSEHFFLYKGLSDLKIKQGRHGKFMKKHDIDTCHLYTQRIKHYIFRFQTKYLWFFSTDKVRKSYKGKVNKGKVNKEKF